MSDLRAIAEAAASGPWGTDRPSNVHWEASREVYAPSGIVAELWEDTVRPEAVVPDAAHIAAWSPDRALAALDVIEAALNLSRDHRLHDRPTEAPCTHPRGYAALRDALDRWEALQ